jgi:hypothetical protein
MGALATSALIINNVTFPIKPNSLSYTEGFGEYKIRVASAGGSKTEKVFTRDIETAYSMVKAVLYTTAENADSAREWKANEDTNVVQIVDSGFTRTINQATIINEPDVSIGVEGEFEVTFHGDSAV